jgi:HlyD family secretion protein
MSTEKKSRFSTVRQSIQRRPVVSLVVLLLIIAGGIVAARKFTAVAPMLDAFHTVKRGDLLISVVEGGALKAVNEAIIRSEFEGVSRIISIVPEGTYVEKGDLLVELDSSDLRDRVNSQEVAYQNTEFAYVQAKENLSIQKSVIESQIKEAELRVEFAKSDLEKYKEGDAPQQKKNAESRITIIEEESQRAQDKLDWTRELHKKGYSSKSELEIDTLAVKRMKLDLEQAQEELRLLLKYDQPKSIRKLESALEQAQKELDRLKQRTSGQIAQAEADLRTRQRTLELTLEKLNEQKQQLANSKIHAPQAGLVVYASSNPFGGGGQILIEEGATVRQRQEIIKLPDVSQMLVEIRVHESHVLQIRPGLDAYVTIDSIPDRRFKATVRKVAVLPNSQSSWSNPNLKVYSTEVLIEDKLPDLKPGVSARAEIIITNLSDTVSVPLQAVSTVKGKQVCFVDRGESPVAVPVTVGFFNEQFIEVKAGLKEGERVLLSPPVSTDSIDLSGSILAAGEIDLQRKTAVRPPATNRPAILPAPTVKPAVGADASATPPSPATTEAIIPKPGAGQAESGQRPSSAEMQRRRDEFNKLSPEEQEARRKQFRERRPQGQGPGGPGGGRGPGAGDGGERRNPDGAAISVRQMHFVLSLDSTSPAPSPLAAVVLG